MRGLDLNQRPSGYEPDELPDCSTPRQSWAGIIRPPPGEGQPTLQQQESPLTAGFLEYGTEEGTRTPTAYGHYHLKVACLPIPPPRQNGYCSGASGTSEDSDAGPCSSSTGTSSTAGFC
ncbi:conserved protein of unknown function [Ectopseudomonas oleovorans]|uniref:Uncharacterized protein n=1 Tax=Ectopseudomonas oleovorans TaxID=301 RepID=A0A653B0W3_ECTOL|nr:conserved protein of unknown function [Pseudomonas oleovorans]